MSFTESLETLVGDGRAVWGFLLAAGIVLALTPLTVRLAARIGAVDVPTDRPRVHTRPIPRIGGIAIVTAILVAGGLFVGGSGPYLGHPPRHSGRRGGRPRRRRARAAAAVKLLAVAVIALIPVLGFGSQARPPHAADHRRSRSRRGGLPAHRVVDHRARQSGQPDRRHRRARVRASWPSPRWPSLCWPRRSPTPTRPRSSAIVCGATLAFLRHNYHPARIFMGDTGALALGFLLAAPVRGGPAEDGGRRDAGRAAARARRADPRHVLRRPQAPQVSAAAVGRRPQSLLSPLSAHRAHPATHRALPPRLGGAARRLRDSRALRSAAPGGPHRRSATRPFSPRPDCSLWRPRYGWSTRWRSSSFGTCRFCA